MSTRGSGEPLDLDTARAYHLGRLDAGLAEALEARYFEDPVAFEVLDASADELVDDYVEGRLTGHDRARLDVLAASPEWAERIRFARALQAVARDGLEPSVTGAPGIAAWLRRHAWPAAFGLAAAAALAVAVGATLSSRRELDAMRARLDDSTAARTAAEAAARAADTRASDERAARESLAQRLQSLTSVAVMLTPGTRSDRVTAVRVPADAATVRMAAVQDDPLPETIVGVRYVLRRGGAQVAGGPVALAAISRSNGSITIDVPASALAAGMHDLHLLIAVSPGRFDEYAVYTFAVVR